MLLFIVAITPVKQPGSPRVNGVRLAHETKILTVGSPGSLLAAP
jgi:hypothetical protein